MSRPLFLLALLAGPFAASPASAQTFSGEPFLRGFRYGPHVFPRYNPGSVTLPGKVPPYIIPPGLVAAALGSRPGDPPAASRIWSSEWIAKVKATLPGGTRAVGGRPGYRRGYGFEFDRRWRYRIAPRLAWRR
ncbi:MAG: hypothetical protein ACRC33_21330 [Gemmataceae bacterium]